MGRWTRDPGAGVVRARHACCVSPLHGSATPSIQWVVGGERSGGQRGAGGRAADPRGEATQDTAEQEQMAACKDKSWTEVQQQAKTGSEGGQTGSSRTGAVGTENAAGQQAERETGTDQAERRRTGAAAERATARESRERAGKEG